MLDAQVEGDEIDTEPMPSEPVGRADTPGERRGGARAALVALFIAAVAFAVSAFAWQQSYFVVERDNGTIGIDHGFPVAGLSQPHTRSDAKASGLPPADRRKLKLHTLRSRSDARKLFDQLLDNALACDEANATLPDVAPDPQEQALPDPSCDP